MQIFLISVNVKRINSKTFLFDKSDKQYNISIFVIMTNKWGLTELSRILD